MTNRLKIKATILHNTLAFAFLFGTISCGSAEIFTKDDSEELNEEKFDRRKDQKDAQFLVNAAEIYMEEIGLAKLAQQKGTTSPVKELGRIMEEDHQNSMDELTSLAKRKKITIPNTITDQGDESYRSLNDKAGDDFNEAYAGLMVKKHESAIAIFDKAVRKTRDKQIREWATSMITVLKKGLNEAQQCLTGLEKK